MLHRVHRNDLAEYLPTDTFIGEVRIDIESPVYWEFKAMLTGAKDERPVQKFLERHPAILGSTMDGHLGRWVVPQKRLGSEHVPDFLLADLNSYGFHWRVVELESPKARMFNRNGDPSAKLTHAIRQIQDWRSWLSKNSSYAHRKVSRGGLGLHGIRATAPGVIYIGRADDLDDSDQDRRAQMSDELRIDIATYDRLLRFVALLSENFDELPSIAEPVGGANSGSAVAPPE
jgi:hypothetical protein